MSELRRLGKANSRRVLVEADAQEVGVAADAAARRATRAHAVKGKGSQSDDQRGLTEADPDPETPSRLHARLSQLAAMPARTAVISLSLAALPRLLEQSAPRQGSVNLGSRVLPAACSVGRHRPPGRESSSRQRDSTASQALQAARCPSPRAVPARALHLE